MKNPSRNVRSPIAAGTLSLPGHLHRHRAGDLRALVPDLAAAAGRPLS